MTSHDNFDKARSRGKLQAFFSLLRWKSTELLSLYEVTKLLKPSMETYRGIMPIPVAKIIGSEGRYHDFTLAFYPRKDMLRTRWESIDEALHRQIILPPSVSLSWGTTTLSVMDTTGYRWRGCRRWSLSMPRWLSSTLK